MNNHFKNYSLDDIYGEIWLPVKGYEDYYMVSNYGRVKFLKRITISSIGKKQTFNTYILKQYEYKNHKYLYVVLYKPSNKNKKHKVHRLVAECFIANPENKNTVNHKYGVVQDNRATELEWATQKEQLIHSYQVLCRVNPNKGKKGILSHMFGRTGDKCCNSKKVLCLNDNKEYPAASEAARSLGLYATNISRKIAH